MAIFNKWINFPLNVNLIPLLFPLFNDPFDNNFKAKSFPVNRCIMPISLDPSPA